MSPLTGHHWSFCHALLWLRCLLLLLDAGLLLGTTSDDRDHLVHQCLLSDPLPESTVLHLLLLKELPFPLSHVDLLVSSQALEELPFPLSHVDLLVHSQHHCPGCRGKCGGRPGGRNGCLNPSWVPSHGWVPFTWDTGDHLSPSVHKGTLPLLP